MSLNPSTISIDDQMYTMPVYLTMQEGLVVHQQALSFGLVHMSRLSFFLIFNLVSQPVVG